MASFLYFREVEKRKLNAVLERERLAGIYLPVFCRKLLELAGAYQQKYGSLPAEISFSFRAGRTLGEGLVRVRLSSESDRLNLNSATEEEILALLLEAGVPEDRALTVRDSLLDWRDEDDEPRPHGAEREFYEGYAPSNRPFRDFGELLLVRGMDPLLLFGKGGLFERITLYGEKKAGEEDSTEEGVRLREGGFYRLELDLLLSGRPFRYVAIFRWGKVPQLLFGQRL